MVRMFVLTVKSSTRGLLSPSVISLLTELREDGSQVEE